jgi:hypothetical protein
MLAEETCK